MIAERPNDEDMVTGTPIKNPKAFYIQKAMMTIPTVYYELFKIIQRIAMVILTIAVLMTMIHVGNEVVTMRNELTKCRATIDDMKVKIINLKDEIAKGIRIRIF